MTSDDNKAELAALYLAGALSDEERRAFEARLSSGCAESVEAVRQLEPVLLALASAQPPETPDPRIKAQLMNTIAASRPGDDQAEAIVIQRAFDTTWEETSIPGVQRRILRIDRERGQVTLLMRMAAGASYPGHVHHGGEECLVLEGDLQVGDQVLREGDYQYAPPGSHHAVQRSETGCVALLIAPLGEPVQAS